MSDAETALADVAAKIPAKRGRKPETAAQRLARLERAVQETRVAIKEGERRKFEAVGAAVLAEAADDDLLKQRVVDILRRRITTAAARADIATLLV